ncbi:unnamed protein product [Ceutorhynchus assimilis]|uniref:Uncharacterized protein n=1 Tax=Ceutorhynchus assimilis TaxID=467358 RepID=A0A9N9MXS5_9CUCU|nr:unnamed protein product [Ceutorhynchus assimilis]
MSEGVGDDLPADPENCVNCKKKIMDQFYMCDLCLSRVHKNCTSLSPCEIKCMPLQKRTLLLVCLGCKKYLPRTPELISLMDSMKNELIELKREILDLKNTSNQQNIYESSYAGMMQRNAMKSNEEETSSQIHTLIIKPPEGQAPESAIKLIKQKVNPAEINVGIRSIKDTKQGSIIVKCTAKQDIERLKNTAIQKLGNNYTMKTPSKQNPRIKIVGYTGEQGYKDVEECIRSQNNWMVENYEFKVT